MTPNARWSVSWMARLLIGQFVGRLVGWSIGWLVGWLVGRSVGWLVGRLVGWSIGWLVDRYLMISQKSGKLSAPNWLFIKSITVRLICLLCHATLPYRTFMYIYNYYSTAQLNSPSKELGSEYFNRVCLNGKIYPFTDRRTDSWIKWKKEHYK